MSLFILSFLLELSITNRLKTINKKPLIKSGFFYFFNKTKLNKNKLIKKLVKLNLVKSLVTKHNKKSQYNKLSKQITKSKLSKKN